MNTICYYTLEDIRGKVKIACSTRRLARRLVDKCGYDGVCYKRKVGYPKYKKFMFMW